MNIFNDLRNLNAKLNNELKLLGNINNKCLENHESIYFLRSIDTKIKTKQVEAANIYTEAEKNLEDGKIKLQHGEKLCELVERKLAQLDIFVEKDEEILDDNCDFKSESTNFSEINNIPNNDNKVDNGPIFENFGIDIVSILKKCKQLRIDDKELLIHGKNEFAKTTLTELEATKLDQLPSTSKIHNQFTDEDFSNLNICYSSNAKNCKESPFLPNLTTNLLNRISHYENDVYLMSSVTKQSQKDFKKIETPVDISGSIGSMEPVQTVETKNLGKLSNVNDSLFHQVAPDVINKKIAGTNASLNARKDLGRMFSKLPDINTDENVQHLIKNESINFKYPNGYPPFKNLDDQSIKDPYLRSTIRDIHSKSIVSNIDSGMQELPIGSAKLNLNSTYDINNFSVDDMHYSKIKNASSNNVNANCSFFNQSLNSTFYPDVSSFIASSINNSRFLSANKQSTKSADDISSLIDARKFDYHSEGNLMIKSILKKTNDNSLVATSTVKGFDTSMPSSLAPKWRLSCAQLSSVDINNASDASMNITDKENVSINGDRVFKKYIERVSPEEYLKFGEELSRENISLETINKVVKFINKKIAIKDQGNLCLLKSSLNVIFKTRTDIFTEFLVNCKRIYKISSEKFGIFYL